MLNKIKNRFNNKKGFTLVELIVVIVIILILAAVLVPNVTKYVENAKKSSIQSDASAIFTQLQAEYTASVAGVASEINKTDGSITINGKSITKSDAAPTNENTGTYNDDGKVITKFAYKSGKYTCTWQNGTWTIDPS